MLFSKLSHASFDEPHTSNTNSTNRPRGRTLRVLSCAVTRRPLTPHGRGRQKGLSTVPAFVQIRPIPAENPSVLRGQHLPVKSPGFILSADLSRLVPPAGPARRVRPQTVRDATLKLPLPKMGEIWASRSRRGPNGVRLRARNTFQSSVRRSILSADLSRPVPPAGPSRRVRPQTVIDAICELLLEKMGEIWASRSRRGPSGVRLRACNVFKLSVSLNKQSPAFCSPILCSELQSVMMTFLHRAFCSV